MNHCLNARNKYPVICVGSAIVDCIIKGFDSVPISASGYFASSSDLAPGGEAVNQSVTISKLGRKSSAVCFTGDDAAAEILFGELHKNQVDTRFVRRFEEAKTPVTVMFVDETGDRKSITNMAHRFNFHPERDMSYLKEACALSLCSLFRAPFNDPEIVSAVVTEAKKHGLPVFADTKLPNANRLELEDLKDSLPMIDYIFPNEKEAAFYTGQTAPEAMADVFLSYGIKNVIIKLGPDGCFFKNASSTLRIPGIPVDAVDATGAGDNFAAGFICRITEGCSIEDALLFGNACGALSTTAAGATTALKDREQVLAFLKEA